MVRFVRRALVAAAACGLFALEYRGAGTGAGARGYRRHRHVHLVRGEHGSLSRLLSRRLRHGSAGDARVRRAAVQPIQSAALRDVRHPGREGTSPVSASAWHTAQRRAHGNPERRVPDASNCASRIQATATLVLVVRDIDAAVAGVKQANVPIVTPGGKPVAMSDGRARF